MRLCINFYSIGLFSCNPDKLGNHMSKFNIILLRACFQFSSQSALGPKRIEVLQLLTTHWVAHCDDFTSYFNLFYHNPREKK